MVISSCQQPGSAESFSISCLQELTYWERRAADGSATKLLQSLRTRHSIEDASLRKLAGVEPYSPAEVWRKEPLLKLGF